MTEFTRKEIQKAINDLNLVIEVRRESYLRSPDEYSKRRIIEAQQRRDVLSDLLNTEGDFFEL